MKKLPEIPATIHVMAGPIAISREEGLFEREETFGKFNWIQRTIGIEATLSEVPSWLTLRHERVHAVLMDAGITGLDHSMEERICDAIALADVMDMVRSKSKKKS
jgi:hypothetical protein